MWRSKPKMAFAHKRGAKYIMNRFFLFTIGYHDSQTSSAAARHWSCPLLAPFLISRQIFLTILQAFVV
jgi:hypothetical protein